MVNCVVVQRVLSVLSDDDATTLLLNPVVVAMLTLPLLQIVSLPLTAVQHFDNEPTGGDYHTVASNLLNVVRSYTTQHLHHCRHDDVITNRPPLMPSATSHTCRVYVQLARYLSEYVNSDHADDNVLNNWLIQVDTSLSITVQPPCLLTQLVAAIFLLRDDLFTLDSCLRLLRAICQSDKTQVCNFSALLLLLL